MHLSFTFISVFYLSAVSAILVNVTIDDTLGDSETGQQITYLPSAGWAYGPNCRGCAATPLVDATQAFDGTWHDSTTDTDNTTAQGLRLASVPFQGTAIYVYCILANAQTSPSAYTDLTFLIDSHLAGNFVHAPSEGPTFTYNFLVYANQSLPSGNHTLTIQNGRVGGPRSTVLLDHLVYSYDKPPPHADSPNNKDPTMATKTNNIGKIVGGIFGAISVIMLCLLGFLWHRQKSSRDSTSSLEASETGYIKRSVPFAAPWLQRPCSPKKKPPPSSRFSFDPSLLVQPMMNRGHTLISRTPPPIVTVFPRNPLPSRPNSLHILEPIREQTPSPQIGPSAPPPLDPRAEPLQPLSIAEWQRRAQLEADQVPRRFPPTDVEISSYYEDTIVRPEPSHHPPPQRRFTVMNA